MILDSRFRMPVSIVLIVCSAVLSLRADKKLPSPEELLKSYGVSLDTASVVSALKSDEPPVREMAARVLAFRYDSSIIPALRKLLLDEYVYARLAAAFALSRHKDPDGKKTLLEYVDAPDGTLVVVSAGYLLELDDRSSVNRVITVVDSSKELPSRILAVKLLSKFGAFEENESLVNKKLIALLDSTEDSRIRRVAAEELQRLNGDEVRAAFVRVIDDKDPVVKGIAEQYVKSGRR